MADCVQTSFSFAQQVGFVLGFVVTLIGATAVVIFWRW